MSKSIIAQHIQRVLDKKKESGLDLDKAKVRFGEILATQDGDAIREWKSKNEKKKGCKGKSGCELCEKCKNKLKDNGSST